VTNCVQFFGRYMTYGITNTTYRKPTRNLFAKCLDWVILLTGFIFLSLRVTNFRISISHFDNFSLTYYFNFSRKFDKDHSIQIDTFFFTDDSFVIEFLYYFILTSRDVRNFSFQYRKPVYKAFLFARRMTSRGVMYSRLRVVWRQLWFNDHSPIIFKSKYIFFS
jgi:hypothetical protein